MDTDWIQCTERLPDYTSRIWCEEFALVRILTREGEFDAMYNDREWRTDERRLEHHDVIAWRYRPRGRGEFFSELIMWIAWPLFALAKHWLREKPYA